MVRYNTITIVFIILFFFSLGFLIYEGIRTPRFNPLAFIPPLLVLTWTFLVIFGEYMGSFYKIPNFISPVSGVIGAVVKGPIKEGHYGNQVSYKIAIFNRYVPKTIKKEGTFGSFLSATTQITITDDESKFRWIPSENLEANEGCLIYEGRLDKAPFTSPYDDLLNRLKMQSTRLQNVTNMLQAIELEAANLAQMKSMDIDVMSERLKTIADRVKQIKVITRGAGAMEMIEEAGE